MNDVHVVNHTADPGGGELALLQLLKGSPASFALTLLAGGPMVSKLSSTGSPVEVLDGPLRSVRLWRRLRRLKSGVLLSNSLRSAVLVALTRPRRFRHIVYVRDGLDLQSLSPLRRALAHNVTSYDASLVLVNSEWTRSTLSARAQAKSRVVYTMSGVRCDEVPSNTPVHVGSLPVLRVVFVGRLVHWKGPDIVIDAVADATRILGPNSVSLTMIGSAVMGPESFTDELRQRADSHGIPVQFAGQVDDVAEALESHDVLVHASRRPEPFGQVVVQGAAAGVAVLAARSGGTAEILSGVPEALYEPGSVIDLSSRLVQFARDRTLLRSAAHRMLSVARQFADEPMLRLLLDAVEEPDVIQSTTRQDL